MAATTADPKQDTSKKFLKFRLVEGFHIQNDVRTGKERVYSAGDIIESTIDLSKELDKTHPAKKFQRINFDIDEGETSEAAKPTEKSAPKGPPLNRATLMERSLPDLQRLAAEEEIDLAGATKKEDVVTRILKFFKIVEV